MNQSKKPSRNGFAQIPNILFRTEALSPNAKLLLGYLYTFGKRCFPAQSTIVKHLGISKPTVIKAIKELQRQNILSYVKGAGRRAKANEYTIMPVSEWRLDVERPKRMSKPALLISEASTVKDVYSDGKPALLISVNQLYSNNTQQKYSCNNTGNVDVNVPDAGSNGPLDQSDEDQDSRDRMKAFEAWRERQRNSS
jgi:hypothetical protein